MNKYQYFLINISNRIRIVIQNFLLIFSLSYTPILFHITSAISGTISEQSKLDFGTIALKNNDAAYTIRIRDMGQIINDPEIVIISSGAPAEYFLSDFPSNTLLNITVTSSAGIVSSPSTSLPINQDFTISNFDFLPLVTTNASGEYTLYVGATLTTTGNSNPYDDTFYATNIIINISY